MSNSRLEKFIYAICGMEVDDLPTPLSRIETLWNCLITGETPDFEPLSRNEKYLMSMLTGDVDALPEPASRSEKLLYKIATGETDLSDVPGYLSRYEELLKQLIENGGIGGTDFEYVLYTLNQPLSTLYSTAEDIVNTATIYGDTVVNTLQEPSDLAVTPIGENIDISNTTVNGTVEGKVKSAILKGQTLVNLLKFDELDSKTNKVGDTITVTNGTDTSAWYGGRIYLTKSIERNKKYIVMWDNLEWTHTHVNGKMGVIQVLTKNASTNRDLKIEQTGNDDRNYMIFSCTDENADLSKVQIAVLTTSWATGEANNLTTIKGLKVLEYQDGMENWDIPYFEGMQSVKMPVLTTVGKNLADITKLKTVLEEKPKMTEIGDNEYKIVTDGRWNNHGVYWRVKLKAGETIYFKTSVKGISNVRLYDGTGNTYLQKGYTSTDINIYEDVVLSYTASQDMVVMCRYWINDNWIGYIKSPYIAINDSSYEPYKSNILSTPQDVELRGIGEVKDTLDGNTGELTQRIGEDVLNGDITGYQDTNYSVNGYSAFRVTSIANIPNGLINVICDKVKYYPNINLDWTKQEEFFTTNGNLLFVKILSTKASNFEEFRSFLSSAPITIQYKLETPTIKTVDLSITDQDGNETSHLHVFNNTTHISTSAECLLPNVVIPADISYPSIIEANTLYTVKLKRPVTNGNLLINLGGTEQLVTSDCFTIQTPATLTSQNVIFSGKGNVISEVTVVEGDHTEKEYGYFEGMMSVRMPVLTTTGKNVVGNYKKIVYRSGRVQAGASLTTDGDFVYEGLDGNRPTLVYEVKPNENVVISSSESLNGLSFYEYSGEPTFAREDEPTLLNEYYYTGTQLSVCRTMSTNTKYVGLSFYTDSSRKSINKLQVELGTQVSQYEPYKTNILTATSKNLFDMNRPYDAITDSQATVVQDTNQITVSSVESGIYVNANFILDKDFFAGKTVTGSCLYESDENDIGTVQITYQDGDGEYHYQWIKTPKTFTFPNSFIGDVMLSVSANNTGTPQTNTVTVKNIQLELGSTATPYEPYSEVVLRGIGDVKDTLDGNTGELTQRVGEIVLDGSDDEGWVKHSTTNTFYSAENTVLNSLTRVLCICDKMIAKQVPSNTWLLFGEVGVFNTKVGIGFNGALEELIIYLQQNPITVQYELETPIIKTVVISTLDQDGQPTKLSTFNDITHVSIEAEDLLPIVDLEVATKIEETLSSLPTQMIDISETQQSLNEKIDEQAENINEVSTAMIEIRNDIL